MIMIGLVAAKFLINGAVKSLIIKPAISATLTIIPSANMIQTSLLGKDIILNSKDILQFGLEKLYERFGEKKLKFKIENKYKQYYKIVPQNELARIFMKDYADVDELLIDLNKMEEYLDLLISEGERQIDAEAERIFADDEVVLQMIHDIDLAVDRSRPGTFGKVSSDAMLVEEILRKNQKMVERGAKKKRAEIKRKKRPRSVIDEVLNDFPSVPKQPVSDTQLIDAILDKIQSETTSKSKRRKVRS